MNLEKQCISLEIARKLKELGVEQESLFYYLNIDGEGKYYIYFNKSMPEEFEYEGDPISAFTAAELGELLPNQVNTKKDEPFDNFRLYITKFISINDKMQRTNNFIVNYDCDTVQFSISSKKLARNIYDPNLANAMGKMLIYLIENDLMPEDKSIYVPSDALKLILDEKNDYQKFRETVSDGIDALIDKLSVHYPDIGLRVYESGDDKWTFYDRMVMGIYIELMKAGYIK